MFDIFLISYLVPAVGGIIFFLPAVYRVYISGNTYIDDGFGLPFLIISLIPVVNVLVILFYILYLIPLSWYQDYHYNKINKNKEPINCPYCGHKIYNYDMNFYGGCQNTCPNCLGKYVSKYVKGNKFTTEVLDN